MSSLKHTEQNVFAAYVCAFRHHYHKGSRKAAGSSLTVPSGTHSDVLMMPHPSQPSPLPETCWSQAALRHLGHVPGVLSFFHGALRPQKR